MPPIQHPYFPPVFPCAWAGAWGEDEFGLWQRLILKDSGVEQTFRWLAPGEFLMGSPENERERDDDEIQHRVILTEGFWLADSACTQALWQAVLGNNPAHFQDNLANPVEQVTWQDVQQFIAQLNEKIPTLNACLPTEAQWEYACRAGTETPFAFGDNITPEQVNYDGNFPYADGQTGQYREKTLPVKSLPPNAWGLYEMHGNVWEWCQDWYGAYPSAAVTDPLGPTAGTDRVLRGGSWLSFGGRTRSARRNGDGPDDRNHFIGFRLVLGQTVTQQASADLPGGLASGSAARQTEKSARAGQDGTA